MCNNIPQNVLRHKRLRPSIRGEKAEKNKKRSQVDSTENKGEPCYGNVRSLKRIAYYLILILSSTDTPRKRNAMMAHTFP